MHVQPDLSPETSGTSSGFVLPPSTPNSSASETFPYSPNIAWRGLQITAHHGRSASASSGTSLPYFQDHAGPSSAPTTSTMTFAGPQVLLIFFFECIHIDHHFTGQVDLFSCRAISVVERYAQHMSHYWVFETFRSSTHV
jgi:hypothetical protein